MRNSESIIEVAKAAGLDQKTIDDIVAYRKKGGLGRYQHLWTVDIPIVVAIEWLIGNGLADDGPIETDDGYAVSRVENYLLYEDTDGFVFLSVLSNAEVATLTFDIESQYEIKEDNL